MSEDIEIQREIGDENNMGQNEKDGLDKIIEDMSSNGGGHLGRRKKKAKVAKITWSTQ